MQAISENFEALHRIPFLVRAIDGSHILIIACEEYIADYYCTKGFHSLLLQVVVDHSCCFWNYNIRWCSSIHDYNLFCKSHIGKYCLSEKLLPYALLGDVAYQPRPWMFTPYLGSKDGFTREQEHWNFIKSSSQMCVEHAFGILKLRWRILLKIMDCQLRHVPAHVTTCLLLHNLTIMHNDTFNMSWFEDGQTQLQKNLATPSIVAAASTTLLEAETVAISPIDFLHCTSLDSDLIASISNYSSITHQMSMCRDAIAKSQFSRERQRNLAENLDDIHVELLSSESN